MLRIDYEHNSEDTSLRLDCASRRALAAVLGEWLSVYAGVTRAPPLSVNGDLFELVVETRRVLLGPDEQAHVRCEGEGCGSD